MAILSDVAPRTLSLGPIEMIYVNIHPNLESVCARRSAASCGKRADAACRAPARHGQQRQSTTSKTPGSDGATASSAEAGRGIGQDVPAGPLG
ncbi:hypothetical protein THAOC_07464, partial [Thalassiosira oceanica]